MPVCSRRFARPAVWIEKISRQRSSRVPASLGTKGWGSTDAEEPERLGRRDGGDGHAPVGRSEAVGGVGERRLAHPLDEEPLRVDVGHQELVVAPEALSFREDRSVLRDEEVSAEDRVGGGFVDARVGEHVGGDRAARLLLHELAPVLRLSDVVDRGGSVQEDGGPGDGVAAAGRDGHPEVLADLDGEDDAGLSTPPGTGGRRRRERSARRDGPPSRSASREEENQRSS